MRVAITGASGFIGRRLARRHLECGDVVRAFGRHPLPESGVRSFVGDLVTDPRRLVEFVDGADVLYHCAGEIRQEALMRALHVDGTRNLIAAADQRVGRWVQLSSVGAYGPARDASIDESAAPTPVGEYERTKTEADALVQSASDRHAFGSVTIRPSIVFGPGMPNQSVYQFIRMIDRGWFFFLGKPGSIANYVYIDDLIDALLLCGTSPKAAGIYNLSDDLPFEAFVAEIARQLGVGTPSIRVPELPVRMIVALLGKVPGCPLTRQRVDALTRRTRYPSRRIRDHLEFSFRRGTLSGVSELVRDWKSRR